MLRTFDRQTYDTDKIHGILEIYEPLFRPFAGEAIKLLELGVRTGGSLYLWRDYFPRGTIVGLDINPVRVEDPEGRIHVYQGDQQDPALLSRVAAEQAPDGFDLIIDDASHLGAPTRTSFWHLFDRHLKPGGLYAVEDWGTGYWDTWPDGRNYRPRPRWRARALALLHRLRLLPRISFHTHAYGMVGFVKQLIDEQGAAELTRGALGRPPARASKFHSVLVTGRVVVVTKAGGPPAGFGGDETTSQPYDRG
jgi:SAM-dependent methyltransferase